jgi:putative Mg2+ transporter-C (MgtC) family protein
LSLDVELVLRILVGTALGGVIGYERDIHGRPAGLRTHALVALASATFTITTA